MTRIGLISDTHHYLDDAILRRLEECDEIWHAGDFGTVNVANTLKALKPLRGVYGNIDGQDIRSIFPEKMIWKQEEIEVYMTHIGGYPPRYNPALKKDLFEKRPQLFICGHSHILKVMYDETLQCLHMNPGAAGNHGWHKIRTLLRFTVDGNQIKECEVIELGKRGIG